MQEVAEQQAIRSEKTDAILLEEFLDQTASAQSRELAFAAIVRKHSDMVYAVCVRGLNGDLSLADDAMQAVFLLLARNAASLRKKESLGGWLYRVANSTTSNLRRADARRALHEEKAGDIIMDTHLANEEERAWKQVAPFIDELTGSLSPKLRDAVVLYFLEGRQQKDIASLLGCSVDAVKQRVSSALHQLRRKLAKRDIDVSYDVLSTVLATKTLLVTPAALVAVCIKCGTVITSGAAIPAAAAAVADQVAKALLMAKVKTVALTAGLCIAATAVFIPVARNLTWSFGRIDGYSEDLGKIFVAPPATNVVRKSSFLIRGETIPVSVVSADGEIFVAVPLEIATRDEISRYSPNDAKITFHPLFSPNGRFEGYSIYNFLPLKGGNWDRVKAIAVNPDECALILKAQKEAWQAGDAFAELFRIEKDGQTQPRSGTRLRAVLSADKYEQMCRIRDGIRSKLIADIKAILKDERAVVVDWLAQTSPVLWVPNAGQQIDRKKPGFLSLSLGASYPDRSTGGALPPWPAASEVMGLDPAQVNTDWDLGAQQAMSEFQKHKYEEGIPFAAEDTGGKRYLFLPLNQGGIRGPQLNLTESSSEGSPGNYYTVIDSTAAAILRLTPDNRKALLAQFYMATAEFDKVCARHSSLSNSTQQQLDIAVDTAAFREANTVVGALLSRLQTMFTLDQFTVVKACMDRNYPMLKETSEHPGANFLSHMLSDASAKSRAAAPAWRLIVNKMPDGKVRVAVAVPRDDTRRTMLSPLVPGPRTERMRDLPGRLPSPLNNSFASGPGSARLMIPAFAQALCPPGFADITTADHRLSPGPNHKTDNTLE